MTFADLLGRWLAYRAQLVALNLVEASTHANQTDIAFRLSATVGAIEVDALRKSDVELYIGQRRKTCAPVTIRGEINVLRQVLNWAIDEQHMTVKPRLPMVQVATTEAALPSDFDFTAMLAALPQHHAEACEFMMLTGISPHELDRLTRYDVPSHKIEGHFNLMIGYRDTFKVKTASRKRMIPLNPRAAAIWWRWSDGMPIEGKTFPCQDAIQKAMARVRDQNPALRGVTPKMMRKWFASKVAGDNPEHVLQRLMGHSPGSKVTRRHYVRSTDSAQRTAVDGLGIGK